MPTESLNKFDQDERKLLVELLIDHVARDTKRIFEEKKKELFKEIREKAFMDFVENKREILEGLEPPVVLSTPTFWKLAEYKGFVFWDYNRETEFWKLLITCAVYEAHHLPKTNEASSS